MVVQGIERSGAVLRESLRYSEARSRLQVALTLSTQRDMAAAGEYLALFAPAPPIQSNERVNVPHKRPWLAEA